MKKIFLLPMFGFLFFSTYASAETVQLGLMANGDSVMGHVEFQVKQDLGIVAAGGGIDYARGEYTVGYGLVAFRSDQLLPGLKFGLGFKGYLGRVDAEEGEMEGNVSSLAFLIESSYELTASINPAPVPVEVYGGVSFSPSSLSFDETESLQEYQAGLRFYLMKNAYLFIEGRYREIEFEERDTGEWDRDDATLSGGVTLKF